MLLNGTPLAVVNEELYSSLAEDKCDSAQCCLTSVSSSEMRTGIIRIGLYFLLIIQKMFLKLLYCASSIFDMLLVVLVFVFFCKGW